MEWVVAVKTRGRPPNILVNKEGGAMKGEMHPDAWLGSVEDTKTPLNKLHLNQRR